MPLDPELISRAIVVWYRDDVKRHPSRDDARLIETFGAETASCLLPRLRELDRAFFTSDANDTVVGRDPVARILEMGRVAAQQFKSRHPEISDEAVHMLVNAYTFDNR